MRVALLPALALSLAPTQTAALSSLGLDVVGVSDPAVRESLDTRLESASLTVAAHKEDVNDTQDLFGAALGDYSRLVGTLYDEGYYGPSVSIKIDGREAANIDPFSPPRSIKNIQITVDPGPIFTFGQAQVAPRPPTATAVPIVPGFARGDVAHATLVGDAANAGIREWRDAGHAKAAVAGQKIVADHPERQLDVDIALTPGPELRFGKLTISGDRNVSNKRVRQIMGYPEGEVYSPEKLRKAVNRVQRSGVFKTVAMTEADVPNPDGTIDYGMTLIEEKPHRFGFSAEVNTLDGLTLGGFWLHRNLFGGGERLRIEAEAANIGGKTTGLGNSGGTDYSASIRETRPGTFGADNDLFFFGDFENNNDPDYDETSLVFGVGVTRHFTEKLVGEVSGGLRYSKASDAFGTSEYYHAVLPSRLEWDRRDGISDPKGGFYFNVDATPYAGLDAQSQNGMTSQFDMRKYFAFGKERGTVFAGRVLIGSVVGSDLDATPPDFLFFSGGGDTVRGWPYQSLGVTLPNGRTSGGRSFLGLSGEYRQQVSEKIGLVAFVDWGSVGPDSWVASDSPSQTGVGLGFRYGTPIGPIRVDLATPYSDKNARWRDYELYIGVGQAF
ncbi:MAG: outer membrane protein assembly factor [Rhodobacteraceae bacterium]|nr:outer membrane protein assembly factor [Paracoccaceae bacterium]